MDGRSLERHRLGIGEARSSAPGRRPRTWAVPPRPRMPPPRPLGTSRPVIRCSIRRSHRSSTSLAPAEGRRSPPSRFCTASISLDQLRTLGVDLLPQGRVLLDREVASPVYPCLLGPRELGQRVSAPDHEVARPYPPRATRPGRRWRRPGRRLVRHGGQSQLFRESGPQELAGLPVHSAGDGAGCPSGGTSTTPASIRIAGVVHRSRHKPRA